jgi:glycosyltransferase involved in cell wall biosynthesis
LKNRQKRILWANTYCLLDTSSGASMSVRQILLQLVQAGYDVKILGATNFDSMEGALRLRKLVKDANAGQFLTVNDAPLTHRLLATTTVKRREMPGKEEGAWLSEYFKTLKSFKPDLVFLYGGSSTDLMIASEARIFGIPSMFYLANENYIGTRWARDVDLVITDSQATAKLYRSRNGLAPVPVGKFIDPAKFIAKNHERKNLLFVNPSISKGGGIVFMLAKMLQERAPDIRIEVLQSRGSWDENVRSFAQQLGVKKPLQNIIIAPHTDDMRPVYGRARLLLAPSLWWDSGPRVLAESMLNGIPAVVTDHAGLPEMAGEGGIKIKLPPECFVKPYKTLPPESALEGTVDSIISLYRDEDLYQRHVEAAYKVGRERHDISVSTRRLLDVMEPLVDRCAGDGDFTKLENAAFKMDLR